MIVDENVARENNAKTSGRMFQIFIVLSFDEEANDVSFIFSNALIVLTCSNKLS